MRASTSTRSAGSGRRPAFSLTLMGGTVVSGGLVSGSGDNLILVGGEALYDLVLEGDEELRAHPGGGPFNAARTVARLGERVAYLGRLSTDRFGSTLRRML